MRGVLTGLLLLMWWATTSAHAEEVPPGPPIPKPDPFGTFHVIFVYDPADGRLEAKPFNNTWLCQAANQALQARALRESPGMIVSPCKVVRVAPEEWGPKN